MLSALYTNTFQTQPFDSRLQRNPNPEADYRWIAVSSTPTSMVFNGCFIRDRRTFFYHKKSMAQRSMFFFSNVQQTALYRFFRGNKNPEGISAFSQPLLNIDRFPQRTDPRRLSGLDVSAGSGRKQPRCGKCVDGGLKIIGRKW